MIVKEGRVVGYGRTQDGGRPHAERVAISMAGPEARGATAYVTLEPCNVESPRGCCAQALIDAGVSEVHVGQIDPNDHTNGSGVERLRAAGITVHTGLCRSEAEDVHKGFISRITQNRPFITLKIASSLDGKIAAKDGSSQWITGEQARAYAHGMRAGHDAILVGIGTALADDPLLITRVPGLTHKAVRVVLDTHLRIDTGSKLVQTAQDEPLWIIHAEDKDNKKQQLEAAGCMLISSEDMSVSSVVQALAVQGITRLLVEGGAGVHTSFVRSGLYDEIAWFRGDKILGEGLPVLGDLGIESIAEALMLERVESVVLGADTLDIFRKKG
ncbi:MAG: bifunctional diaminohydroxyphosphoribosylaminopyrimidine deaminase/5-amino-6-(5-phosphoribosylamino)uracil reductase RibD [Alphaproteobacteria bacterium]|nr:bifunctional diaminohydroxyphosphoribosylaminopyrimidine deaminase/5-amino-6-(5-phosphoribosylamino)uracil reductase RibD [Alphaproteobacteria bacterium]